MRGGDGLFCALVSAVARAIHTADRNAWRVQQMLNSKFMHVYPIRLPLAEWPNPNLLQVDLNCMSPASSEKKIDRVR